MRIRKLNHSVYQIQYHIVFRTKYRRKILKPYVKVELIKSFYRIQKRHPDWYFHAINTDEDHVHMQIEFPPSYTIAQVVQELKAVSALGRLGQWCNLVETQSACGHGPRRC